MLSGIHQTLHQRIDNSHRPPRRGCRIYRSNLFERLLDGCSGASVLPDDIDKQGSGYEVRRGEEEIDQTFDGHILLVSLTVSPPGLRVEITTAHLDVVIGITDHVHHLAAYVYPDRLRLRHREDLLQQLYDLFADSQTHILLDQLVVYN